MNMQRCSVRMSDLRSSARFRLKHARAGRPPLGAALLAATIPLGCAMQTSADGQTEADPVASDSQPIVNGTAFTDLWFAAVYHKDGPNGNWFSRPCSGTVLRQAGLYSGPSWVLTARHCVTSPSSRTSTNFLPVSSLKVISSPNPGVVPRGTEAPGYPVSFIYAPTVVNGGDPNYDLALLQVDGPMFSNGYRSRVALNVGQNTMLWGDGPGLFVYGYGRNTLQYGTDEQNDLLYPTGAGVLRQASGFTMQQIGSDWAYGFSLYNPQGAIPWVGDSGGPTMVMPRLAPEVVRKVIGAGSLASAYNWDAAIAGNWDWLVGKMRYVTVGRGDALKMDLKNTIVPQLGAQLATTSGSTTTADTRWFYMRSLKCLVTYWGDNYEYPSYCIDGRTGSPTAQICDFSTPNQKWTVTDDDELRNDASGLCLRSLGIGQPVTLGSCDKYAGTFWFFYLQE